MIPYLLDDFKMVDSTVFGALLAFILTVLFTVLFMNKLPGDQGRAFAVEGGKSVGKPRGAGIIFILVFTLCSLIFAKIDIEIAIYLLLIVFSMFTGFFDDASKTPWSDYKKGAFDLVISVLIAVNYLYFNSNTIYFSLIGKEITIPYVFFGILIVILVWVAINVTNCSDGVDGLCATLSIITILTLALVIFKAGSSKDSFVPMAVMLIFSLIAYLWFNANPSTLLMGDAGSRALGVFIAILSLKSGSPFLYIFASLIMILDGGLGLAKVFLLRFLKIHIFKNTTLPLHDHARKKLSWSNTQVVFRFAIIQILFALVTLYIVF